MKYKVLDLFCGAGGLSSGFENAGFKIVGGIDYNKPAIETHKQNFPGSYHYCGDITEITEGEIKKEVPEVDIIIGGPPCQGFSSANRHEKLENDPRNRLFLEYLRFIKEYKPKAFVIENVRGILTRDEGYAKNKILDITSELGYNVNVEVLNSYDYGVPQKRTRAFFVGIKKDYNVMFDFKNIKPIFKKCNVVDAIKDLEEIENGQNFNPLLRKKKLSKIQKYYLNNNEDIIYNHNISNHTKIVVDRIKCVPQGGNWRDVPENLWDSKRTNRHSSAYKRLDYGEPSITIDTGHMNYFHPIYNRVPSVRESARIQSFKDNFIFCGTCTEQYRQVGNAVPPILAQVLATSLRKILEEANENN